MLSIEKIQNTPTTLPIEVIKRWDSDRIKEFTLCLGAAGIAGLGLIDGHLPRSSEPAPDTVMSGPMWPVEADSDLLLGEEGRKPVKGEQTESAFQSTYDPHEQAISSTGEQSVMHPEDVNFPAGTQEVTLTIPVSPAPLPENAPAQTDYSLAR